MALPGSRDLTLIDGVSFIPSSVINNLQDCVVGGKHGNKVLNLPANSALVLSGTVTRAEGMLTVTVSAELHWLLPLHQGDRIKQIAVLSSGNGVADITTLAVRKCSAAGAVSTLAPGGSSPANMPAPPPTMYTLDVDDYVIGAGETLWVRADPTANAVLYGCFVTYDRP